MALATKCPHCNTIFRVAADQLKLRGGIVRCGSCKEVFDGNAALVDPAAAALPAIPLAPVFPAPAPGPLTFISEPDAAKPYPDLHDAEEEPVFALDFDTSYDPFGILPESAQLKPEPEPEPEEKAAPEAEAAAEPAPEPIPAPAPAHKVWARREPEPEPPAFATYLREERRAPLFDPPATEPEQRIEDEAPGSAADETAIADQAAAAPLQQIMEETAEEDAAGEEPGFVKQGRRRQRTGKTVRILLGAGALLLLIGLLAQGMSTFRNQLAAKAPALKPLLESVCAVAGCRVDLPAQIEFMSIEQGELQALSANTFSYATMLRNQSRSAQLWPSIELILNDGNDKPVLRRVIAPRDYLPAQTDLSKGFAPRSEQAVKIYFELAQLKASGYHIAVFYP